MVTPMIINYDKDGLEDLIGFKYIYKRDVFRRNNLYYKYINSCKECGKAFFMRLTHPTVFCSKSCVAKSEDIKNKISRSLMGHKRSKKECQLIADRMSKGGVVSKNLPLFKTYAHQINSIDKVKNNNGLLEVRCSVCNCWYVPKRTQVEQRAQYIKGNVERENRFYCSEHCKHACNIFNKHKYPAGFNPRKHRNINIKNNIASDKDLATWSKEVLKRANYICEICGSNADHAHHIIPKKFQPFLALDPDNGIALCISCHYRYGHSAECSSVNIARVKCK